MGCVTSTGKTRDCSRGAPAVVSPVNPGPRSVVTSHYFNDFDGDVDALVSPGGMNEITNSTSTVYAIPTNNFYAYDSNGNMTCDGYKSFAYDDENQLIGVWVAGAWSNSFAYDGKMRRRIERDYAWNTGISGWQETNEIHFIYDGNLVVEERNASNVPLVSYTRGNDLSGTFQGAGGIGGLLARTTYGQELPGAPTTAFYHADGNGNITALMYPNQQLAAKYLYDPFGNMLAMSGPLVNFNKYRFSSKEWNDNSGLYYYLYRFYDAGLQRWANRDPFGELGFDTLHQTFLNSPIQKPVEFFVGANDFDFVFNDAISDFDLLGLSPGTATLADPLPPSPTHSRHSSKGAGNACDCAAIGGKWESLAQHDFNGSSDACMDACVGHWQVFAGGILFVWNPWSGAGYIIVVIGACEWNCNSDTCYLN